MKKKFLKVFSLLLIVAIGVEIVGAGVEDSTIVSEATTISEVQQNINNTQNNLNSINSKIDALSDEQDLIEEEIDDLNAEIINMMASIDLLEEQLLENEDNIKVKQAEIEEAEAAYYEAKDKEEKRHAAMILRIRSMYENGDATYLSLLLSGDGLGDILNHMDYLEKIYEYDLKMYNEYKQLKEDVQLMWDELVIEKADLEEQKANIEQSQNELKAQKENLDTLLAKKKAESKNYENEIKKYKQEAAVAKKQLQQDKATLKKLQAEQNQGKTPAATGTYTTTDYTSTIDNASGSDMGKRIAKYACQYIGNPYVAGGTSLTNGADCSGFTYRIYSDFGYSIPRTSFEQRSCGTGVEYSSAQPGDLICYSGHVALYIGGGMIVHASSAKTGIKVSNANYKPILAVRRVVN